MSWVSLATPATEACDAVGALRPEWREWPALEIQASVVPAAFS
jgi:hypothetical protein